MRGTNRANMTRVGTTIVASDGSALAIRSATTGLAILPPTNRVIVVTVVDGTYPSLTEDDLGNTARSGNGSGNLRDDLMAEGQRALEQTAAAMDRAVETRLVEGSPGIAICQLADDESADAIVLGSHGHGGIRRALLGSVSDYVVRNAPCPVVISGSDVHPN
jgi:nucleotide-binding universal stress UspA family protein